MNDKQRRDYMKTLVSLYEAVGITGAKEVIPQEQIADSGQDVLQDPTVAQDPKAIQQMVNDAVDQKMADEEVQEEPMEDTAYLQQQPMADPTETVVLEKQKFVKLFNLIKDLSTYSEAYEETLSEVDLGLLDDKQIGPFRDYASKLDEFTEKIKSYLINVFNSETYEKNLYTYVLFRTELITMIKSLRQLLKFDELDDDEFKKLRNKNLDNNLD